MQYLSISSDHDEPSDLAVMTDVQYFTTLQKRLTLRQQEILLLIRKGLCNKEIAERLHIEVQTVRNHAHTIFGILGIKKRSEVFRERP